MLSSLLLKPMITLAEKGRLPDWVIRTGIRRLCRQRLREVPSDPFVDGSTDAGTIAVETERANEQHYELPSAFFEAVLGSWKKYSCCYWDASTGSLDDAERRALQLTCEHAGLEDGMRVLDLGCGWGSLTRWIAQEYPACQITSISNAGRQIKSIRETASREGFGDRLVAEVVDINHFSPGETYDRIISVEMFEHVLNHTILLDRISSWLAPGGKLLIHVFCHHEMQYRFEVEGPANWMGRHFFTGGSMPSSDLIPRSAKNYKLENQWNWNGRHYQRTAEAWLQKMDAGKKVIWPLLQQHYGSAAKQWWWRWRIFFLSVSELFGYGEGKEWSVAHYLLMNKKKNE